jgi:hypothetical protein
MTDDELTNTPEYSTSYLIDGEQWDYDNPLSNEFTIHSVAHALARENRYNGHIESDHYSVAEHAVLVSVIVMEHYGEKDPAVRRLGLAALHHDDAEFVTKDITNPEKKYLKRAFGLDWHDVERPVMQAISNKWEIPMDEFSAAVIKDADNLAYAAEIAILKPKGHGPMIEVEPETLVKVTQWIRKFPPKDAESVYVMMHNSLMRWRDAGYPDQDAEGMDVEPRDDGPDDFHVPDYPPENL